MPTPQLPKTQQRLATSASFYILREDVVSPRAIFGLGNPDVQNQARDILSKMIFLKGLTSFTERQERSTSSRWEVDSDVAGKALQVLQQPLDRTITLKRAVFYDSDLVQVSGYETELKKRTGVPDGSILSQLQKPFILIKKEVSPEGSGAPTIMTLYRGCVFQSLSRSYELSGSLAVVDDAMIRYADRMQIKI